MDEKPDTRGPSLGWAEVALVSSLLTIGGLFVIYTESFAPAGIKDQYSRGGRILAGLVISLALTALYCIILAKITMDLRSVFRARDDMEYVPSVHFLGMIGALVFSPTIIEVMNFTHPNVSFGLSEYIFPLVSLLFLSIVGEYIHAKYLHKYISTKFSSD